jgi:SAM-dependent MidA family methyltransferase
MGIDARMSKILSNNFLLEKQINQITKSYQRLTSENEMGKIYKCFVISQDNPQNPTGFFFILL